MSTLDEYFAPRAPASEKNAILSLILVSVDSGSESGRSTLAFKLGALLHFLRELHGEVGYAGVDSIRDYLIMKGVVKSELEVQRLLKFAHRLGLIGEGQIPSTWGAVGAQEGEEVELDCYFHTERPRMDMRRRGGQARL
jgi:hypothetical protein